MRHTTDHPGSEIVSELFAGAITGVASVRKLFYRTILVVAIAVAAVSFTIGMMFRDYLTGKPVPAEKRPIPATTPGESQQAKPPPSKRNGDEELPGLIRKGPL